METGIVTEESLATVLRQVGQKRKQGALELAYPDVTVQVLFLQGKVVEVVDPRVNAVQDIVSQLKLAGLVPDSFVLAGEVASAGGIYRALFLALGHAGIELSEDLYRRVIKHRILERLYRLDLTKGAVFNFRVQSIEVDREFAPTISIGQVLLDLVALPATKERFHEVFRGVPLLGRVDMPEGILTADERIIYDALREPCSPLELEQRSLLNHFHFMDGLLALEERGLIAAEAEADPKGGRLEGAPLRELVQQVVVAGAEAEVLLGAIAEASPVQPSKELQESSQAIEGDDSDADISKQAQAALVSKAASERWSKRALESAAAVQVVAVVYVLICLAVPWLTWSHVMEFFSHR